MTFGEFAGFLCGCNLALELTISAAAVARGWTSYVATLFHAPPNALRVNVGGWGSGSGSGVALDFPAAGLTALIISLLIYGMKAGPVYSQHIHAVFKRLNPYILSVTTS